MPGARTRTARPPSIAATVDNTWPSIGRPAIGWRALGRLDFMRVLLPAARMTVVTASDIRLLVSLMSVMARRARRLAYSAAWNLARLPPSFEMNLYFNML